MAKAENIIKIPKVPASAFNPQRPVSDLLWEQVEHLAAVVRRQIDDERRTIRTEGQASAFIKKYTAFLHPREAGKKATPSKAASKKTARSSKSGVKKSERSSGR